MNELIDFAESLYPPFCDNFSLILFLLQLFPRITDRSSRALVLRRWRKLAFAILVNGILIELYISSMILLNMISLALLDRRDTIYDK